MKDIALAEGNAPGYFVFEGKKGQIVLDQIRTVDKIRLVKKLGKISASTRKEVLVILLDMFAE
jgi:mRNA interferase MazF